MKRRITVVHLDAILSAVMTGCGSTPSNLRWKTLNFAVFFFTLILLPFTRGRFRCQKVIESDGHAIYMNIIKVVP